MLIFTCIVCEKCQNWLKHLRCFDYLSIHVLKEMHELFSKLGKIGKYFSKQYYLVK